MVNQISYNTISIEVNSLGAELIQFSKGDTKYIWNVDEAFWNKTSPILFPIVGRLKNDCYNLNGKNYNMASNRENSECTIL